MLKEVLFVLQLLIKQAHIIVLQENSYQHEEKSSPNLK